MQKALQLPWKCCGTVYGAYVFLVSAKNRLASLCSARSAPVSKWLPLKIVFRSNLIWFASIWFESTQFDSFPFNADSIRLRLGFDAIRFRFDLDSIQIQFGFDSTWFDSTWLDSIWYSDSFRCFDALLRFMDSMHWFDSVNRFIDSTYWFASKSLTY